MNGCAAICVVIGTLMWVASSSAAVSIGIGRYSQQVAPSRAEAGGSITVTSSRPGREGYAPVSVTGGGENGTNPLGGSSASSGTSYKTPNGESWCVYAGESNVSPCYGVVPGPGTPAARGPARPRVNPAAMAALASSRLVLIAGQIKTSPSATTAGLTGAASWFWLSPTPSTQSLSVSAGAEHVTVTASASAVRWSFGDSSSFTGGPGVAYRTGPTPANSVRHIYKTRCLPGDQGHDPYVSSSCGPNGYQIQATVEWQVSYQASGPITTGGSLPTRTTETAITYPVSEVRAFLTAGSKQ
jgi:hypothetical protein